MSLIVKPVQIKSNLIVFKKKNSTHPKIILLQIFLKKIQRAILNKIIT
jgi:hypothetical protein